MAYVVEEPGAIALETQPRLAWSAIFAGWLVATGIAGLLYLAGLALGFSAFDANEAGGKLNGIGIGSMIWMVVTWVVALFLGGMFASWFDGRADDTIGSMHGMTVWGLSLTSTALWLALGFGAAMQGDADMHGNWDMHGNSDSTAVKAAQSTGAVGVLHAHVTGLIGNDRQDARDDAGVIVAALLVNTPASDRIANPLLDADPRWIRTTPAPRFSGCHRRSRRRGLRQRTRRTRRPAVPPSCPEVPSSARFRPCSRRHSAAGLARGACTASTVCVATTTARRSRACSHSRLCA